MKRLTVCLICIFLVFASFSGVRADAKIIANRAPFGATVVRASSSSLPAYISAVRTTNIVTIIVEDNQGIGDDLTIPSNITLWMLPGGIIAPASGKTVTIYSPANIIAQPDQKIFGGDGLIRFTVGDADIYADWWGFDSQTCIQSAIDSTPVGYFTSVRLLGKNYAIGTNGITITKHNVRLSGLSYGADPYFGTIQTTITYTGTGGGSKAISASPSSGTYIECIQLENFNLILAQDTETGMYLKGLSRSIVKNIQIYGSNNKSGSNTNGVGLYVLTPISTKFEFVRVDGDASGATAAQRLPYGLYSTWDGTYAGTTAIFGHCYFRTCMIGAYNYKSRITFRDSIFESDTTQGLSVSTCPYLELQGSYFENNAHAIETVDSTVRVFGGQMDLPSAGEYFIGGSSSTASHGIIFYGTRFIPLSTSPWIFDPNDSFEIGVYGFYGCIFDKSGSVTYKGTGGTTNSLTYLMAPIGGVEYKIYRFKQTACAADHTYSKIPTTDTDAADGNDYYLPRSGYVVGVNVYHTAAMVADGFQISIIAGSKTVESISYATRGYIPVVGQKRGHFDGKFLIHNAGGWFNAGDTLYTRVITSAGLNPTAGDLTVDVVVAFCNRVVVE